VPIALTWSINDLRYNTADDGVFEVHWSLTAQADTGETAVEYGKETWEYDTSAPDWVAIVDLTEETVIGWVKEHLGAEKVAEIEESRKGKVEAQIARKTAVASGLPWTPVEPELTGPEE
jgi:hypothetical protein